MIHTSIVLPSKPKVIKEKDNKGSYEVEGLYPGYGHTLGNSLRRIKIKKKNQSRFFNLFPKGTPYCLRVGLRDDRLRRLLLLRRRLRLDPPIRAAYGTTLL